MSDAGSGGVTGKVGFKPAIGQWYQEKLDIYEAATGLEQWTPPEED